ncbi:MAG: hypothetical protein NC090_02825 [Anaeroplasma bactoclasticum]|nr:hypothetical protein [Anaeroplasma bactoclasticum]
MAEELKQAIFTTEAPQTNESNPQDTPTSGLNPDGTPSVLEEKPKRKLSKVEKKKLRVIKKLLLGEINGTEAAKKLGITTRQIRNLKRQVLNEGTEGVVHKNKNYKPYNTYDTEISTFVCKLYRKEYRGTNFSEFARICQEQYGVEASRSTIYNFLRRGRIRSPQRKKKKKKIDVVTTNSTTPKKKTTQKKAVSKKTTSHKKEDKQ